MTSYGMHLCANFLYYSGCDAPICPSPALSPSAAVAMAAAFIVVGLLQESLRRRKEIELADAKALLKRFRALLSSLRSEPRVRGS